jgi:peptidyl-prolyl cis-trans isomerase A (cyclophilin A)
MQKLPYCLLLLFVLAGCSPKTFNARWVKEKAPEYFKARFETTSGNFEIEARREWSPLAVDRFYQLIKHHYYNNTPIYRVIPNFVAQFGSVDTTVWKKWESNKYADEPVLKKNTKGTLSFATDGKETRGSQLFINLKDNPKLDTLKSDGVIGYPGIATVTKGMELVQQFFSYGETPNDLPDSVNHVTYYPKHFPKMDKIKKAYFIK